MIDKNVNVELEATTKLVDSYRTAGVIVAEIILLGESFGSTDLKVDKLLLTAIDVEAALNESFDIEESLRQGDDVDFLYFKKCIVLSIFSSYSIQLAQLDRSNNLNDFYEEAIRSGLTDILKRYPQYSKYDVEELICSAKNIVERLFDICSIRDAIINVANILQATFLSDERKIEELFRLDEQIPERLYIEYKSILDFFSNHFPTMEEFYILDMEYHDSYPSYWLS